MYHKTNLTKKPELVVWKEVFWDYFLSWSLWTWIYLNNPTGLTYWNSKLFISDTSNNRVLYLSWNLIYPLLDINDWIYQPKWLYFDNLLNRYFLATQIVLLCMAILIWLKIIVAQNIFIYSSTNRR